MLVKEASKITPSHPSYCVYVAVIYHVLPMNNDYATDIMIIVSNASHCVLPVSHSTISAIYNVAAPFGFPKSVLVAVPIWPHCHRGIIFKKIFENIYLNYLLTHYRQSNGVVVCQFFSWLWLVSLLWLFENQPLTNHPNIIGRYQQINVKYIDDKNKT